MAISGTDYVLVDTDTGTLLNADSTVVVPEVMGDAAYELLEDADAAIQYADAQGVELNHPGEPGISVDDLEDEARGYLAIDASNGFICNAASLVLLPWDGEGFEDEAALELASSNGGIPVVGNEVLDAEGLPFESIVED